MKAPNLRRDLARNLARLMESKPGLDTQQKVAAASGVAQSTIGRILSCKVAATIDNLGGVAQAFGVSACDLLRNEQSNSIGKMDAPIRAELRALSLLPEPEQDRILSFIRFTMGEYGKGRADLLSMIEERELSPGRLLRSSGRLESLS